MRTFVLNTATCMATGENVRDCRCPYHQAATSDPPKPGYFGASPGFCDARPNGNVQATAAASPSTWGRMVVNVGSPEHDESPLMPPSHPLVANVVPADPDPDGPLPLPAPVLPVSSYAVRRGVVINTVLPEGEQRRDLLVPPTTMP